MKLKKIRKSRKMRGTRYHGMAAKKHKGKGSHGGKGLAGTGKRADQKKSYVLKYKKPYFGKKGARSNKIKLNREKVINLGDIERNLAGLVKKNNAVIKNDVVELSLDNYKVLGSGEIKIKLVLKAKGVSKSAKEKIEKAGGKILE